VLFLLIFISSWSFHFHFFHFFWMCVSFCNFIVFSITKLEIIGKRKERILHVPTIHYYIIEFLGLILIYFLLFSSLLMSLSLWKFMYNLNSFFTFCYMSILHVVCLVFLTIFFSSNHLFKIKLQLPVSAVKCSTPELYPPNFQFLVQHGSCQFPLTTGKKTKQSEKSVILIFTKSEATRQSTAP